MIGRLGLTISSDITKKQDLQRVVDKIKDMCLPIAGVLNGAAVVQETLFSEMSLEAMEKVIKPKIDGTNHLDEIFKDTSLDFFIVFSSLTSVIGSSGQSNYTAGNAYLTGLVNRRRKRGLAGTCLDIGRIAGIGNIEASDIAQEQFGFIATSETDLHQLLAEAIRAGIPGLGAVPVLTTGCRTVSDDEEPRVAWFDDPRFSHKIVKAQGEESKSDGKKSTQPVRDQLAGASTMEEALEILKGTVTLTLRNASAKLAAACFTAKLTMISQLADEQVGNDVPLIKLGIDSLVAVEVRSWFLKELKTDMPVLKILGGFSVADLCQQALEKLPENLLPRRGAELKAAESAPPKRETAPKSETSSAASVGTSSGSQSPVDTPATHLSPASSTADLAGAAEKASNSQRVDQASAYVKSELVSFAQSRFWFLRLLVEDQTAFNVSFYYRITGNLRIGDFERAVRLVTTRHESLRTCFVADEKEADLAHQKVLPGSLIRLERKKINSIEELQVEYAAIKAIPFDITSGKLMRLVLLTLSPTQHYLIFNYHHIVMDGVSLQVFLADLEKAYQRQSLGAPPHQLPDFSRSQRAAFQNGDMDDEIAYWRDEFPSGHPVLPLLPMAKVSSRMPLKSFHVNQVEYRLEPELAARVKEISKSHESTPFHFYLATFKAMLFRFTDAQDLTIGIADANRNDSDVMGTVGLLLNLLTLRFKYEPNQQFGDCIAEARNKAYKALANSRVPFDVLLKELNVPRSSSYSPFFQAFFDYRQGHQEKQPFGNTKIEFLELHPGRTAYDMTLDIMDSSDSARVIFRTQGGLYDETAAQLLLDTYIHLLEIFSSDTSLPLQEPPLFSDEELERALDMGRGKFSRELRESG